MPKPTKPSERNEGQTAGQPSRREVLKTLVGSGVGLALTATGINLGLAQEATKPEPNAMPPQKGDFFVFVTGSKKGQLVTTDDVPLNGPQVQVWPAEVSGGPDSPTVSVVRDQNVQNMVLLARFPADQYSADTKPYITPDGVVAYAATCTHQCCVVSEWLADQHSFHCPCHGSIYNPLNHAQQTPDSPAPRPLPQLPLAANADGGKYPVVASGFRTTVGCGPTMG